MKRVAVFGMGYVGCVTAACLSRDGHRVIGVDVDAEKVATVNAGCSPVSEPGLDDLIGEQVQAGRLSSTTDVAAAIRDTQIALIAVGTPSGADGSVQSLAVERVVEGIGRILSETDRDYTVVIRSTLLPGILEERLAPRLAAASGCEPGGRIRLLNHPEFLRETTAIKDYDQPPFIVVGADDPATAERIFELYPRTHAEHIQTDTRTAALVKYACNAFHATKIGFANEIGTLARAMGADGQGVMRIVCRDTQLNISTAYLRPGFAFGGSCLPKDLRALNRFAQQQAIQTDLLDSILPSNESHIARALTMIREADCRKIGLVGLSFKAGTDDLRESPQVILAETLLGRGYDLKIFDPGVRSASLIGSNRAYIDEHLPHLAALLTDSTTELFAHSELLIVGTGIGDQIDLQAEYFGRVIDLRRDLVVPVAFTEPATSSPA